MTYIMNLFSSSYFLTGLSFIVAFISAIRIFPVVIYTVRTKNLMDEPGGRKIHASTVPTLGGVGLFASFSLSIILFSLAIGLGKHDLVKLLSVIAATLILLFLGIKDDLIAIPPKKKLVAQLIAASIVIFSSDLRITSFNFLFGIGELPYLVSILITIFVYIVVINAFNLIDGIDGLAGSIAVMSCCMFGFFFFRNGDFLMSLMSFTLIGATFGFLQFNLSKSPHKKLFMGDSGSMFIGFLLAYQGIAFLSTNAMEGLTLPIANAPVMLLAILSFPLADTLRVFTVRIKAKKSPFSPDKNHIHHRLLKLGYSHRQSTSIILGLNWMVLAVMYLTESVDVNVQFIILLFACLFFYLSPYTSFGGTIIAMVFRKKKAAMFATDKSKIDSINQPKESVGSGKLVATEHASNHSPNIEFTESNATSQQSVKKESKLQKVIDKRIALLKESESQWNDQPLT